MPLYRTTDGDFHAFNVNEARENNDKCDVFVSHKKDDKRLAMQVYNCIMTYGLEPWIDLKDPTITGDGPDLDSHIQDVISNSFSLMAVVSDITQQSWWVPFEIGVAFDQKCILATYVEEQSDESKLPSFLAKHPRIKRHEPDLHDWCKDIKQTKERLGIAQPLMESREGRVIRASVRSTYLNEMRRMTRQYR